MYDFDVFYQKEMNEKLQKDRIDITLQGKSVPMGKVHPLTQTTNEIVTIFQNLGFSLVPSEYAPEVETEYFNFDMLNVPKEHPARDVQDTFYVEGGDNIVLRSQTSGAQIHAMLEKRPPVRVIAPGRVYRNENISARKNNLFHQIEGLYIDKNITMSDLIADVRAFLSRYFGIDNIELRIRPSYFPFTDPSIEIDLKWHGDKWLEIMGAGMVHPNVLRNCGIDPDMYQGFAFGFGWDRLAMLKYNLPDLRDLYNNDVRWLRSAGF